jgi:hypothetical protein
MAIPQGAFQLYPTGMGFTKGGAYGYLAGTVQSMYYAGTFFIDTGYDDPVTWTAGTECAEIYNARVYGASGNYNPSAGAGTYVGKWNINATPVWSSKFWQAPHSNTSGQQRVLIKCDVWLSEPVSTASGAWQRLDSVAWTLYKA